MRDTEDARRIAHDYFNRTAVALGGVDIEQVAAAVDVLQDLRDTPGRVFVLGNGGSQSAASHLVLHLREDGIPAIDVLADNAALTAISNDVHYDGVAWRVIESFKPTAQDVLFFISGSGTSKNVVLAVGRFPGVTCAITGVVQHAKDRGDFAPADYRIAIPTNEYGPMEDASIAVIHAIHNCLQSVVD